MPADTENQAETAEQEQTNGAGESNGGHRTAVRAAAIAAATGATAFAAKKAFSNRGEQSQGEGEQRPKKQRRMPSKDDSAVGAMIASGWDAAKDSLLPFAEDAAESGGEWVAKNSPEIVSDTIVPRFIRGFEKARKGADEDE